MLIFAKLYCKIFMLKNKTSIKLPIKYRKKILLRFFVRKKCKINLKNVKKNRLN